MRARRHHIQLQEAERSTFCRDLRIETKWVTETGRDNPRQQGQQSQATAFRDRAERAAWGRGRGGQPGGRGVPWPGTCRWGAGWHTRQWFISLWWDFDWPECVDFVSSSEVSLFGLFKFSDTIKLASCNENIKKEFTFKNLYGPKQRLSTSPVL